MGLNSLRKCVKNFGHLLVSATLTVPAFWRAFFFPTARRKSWRFHGRPRKLGNPMKKTVTLLVSRTKAVDRTDGRRIIMVKVRAGVARYIWIELDEAIFQKGKGLISNEHDKDDPAERES